MIEVPHRIANEIIPDDNITEAVDNTIAAHLGELAAKAVGSYHFIIVTRDRGFLTIMQRLRSQGFEVMNRMD